MGSKQPLIKIAKFGNLPSYVLIIAHTLEEVVKQGIKELDIPEVEYEVIFSFISNNNEGIKNILDKIENTSSNLIT